MKNSGIVLFSQRVEYIEAYGERRDCADQRISEFIYDCGYIPLPVPNSVRCIEALLEQVSPLGIVLTGGNSLVKYGGNAPERDETDHYLIKYSVDHEIPLYGFCRGMQSILDYFGNSLVNVENHVAVRHVVAGDVGMYTVNSYHNQGCTELISNDLLPILCSDDGVIEMVKHKSLPIVGTMWHPEREYPFSEDDIKRIKQLFGGNQ